MSIVDSLIGVQYHFFDANEFKVIRFMIKVSELNVQWKLKILSICLLDSRKT